MKIGDYIETPRFLEVEISAIFAYEEDAFACGYNEPTHYRDDDKTVLGKSIGINHMRFAVVYNA
jgi:hypothetical protein